MFILHDLEIREYNRRDSTMKPKGVGVGGMTRARGLAQYSDSL